MTFNDLQLHSQILTAISRCGFTKPTPIQERAIPQILAQRDILGLAQTGTGKTASFILPTVHRLLATPGNHIKALVLTPTRELAEQINTFATAVIKDSKLKSMAIYGGVSKPAQITRLKRGTDIVVACPGRLLDIVRDKAIDLSKIEIVILDEADHMFDQGFLADIRNILQQLPKRKQALVFSATMPKEIRKFAEKLLHEPAVIEVDHAKPLKSVRHKLCNVQQLNKINVLLELLKLEEEGTSLVFTRTKRMAKKLSEKLIKLGLKATSIQGNLSQNKRQMALNGFKDGTFNILVATDIAARGIDVAGLHQVINFDVPGNAEAYIHRTGRTGRASSHGDAYTLATKDDHTIIRAIEKALNKKLDIYPVATAGSLVDQKRKVVKTKSIKTKNAASAKRKERISGKNTFSKTGQQSVFGLSKQ